MKRIPRKYWLWLTVTIAALCGVLTETVLKQSELRALAVVVGVVFALGLLAPEYPDLES